MSQPSRETLEIKDLSKGLNLFDPETAIPEGFYVDAQNILLSEKAPITIGGLTKLTTTAAPDSRVIQWVEPFSYSDPATGTFHFLVALNEGADTDGDGAGFWKYVPSTDTWSPMWVQLGRVGGYRETIGEEVTLGTMGGPYVSIPFRQRLFVTPACGVTRGYDPSGLWGSGQGKEVPLKYDGVNILPVGAFGENPEAFSTYPAFTSQLVADFESGEATWSGGTLISTAGNRKEGSSSRQLASVTSMSLTYSPVRDFLTGLLGAPNLTTTDFFNVWIKRTSGSGAATIRYRFGNAADTAFFEVSTTPNPADSNWYLQSIARSSFATTGAPSWSSIDKFTIFLDTASNTIHWDAAYWAYNLSPPPDVQVLEIYNQQLACAGQFHKPTLMTYSDVGTPDYFSTANTALFNGGRSALEQPDRITAMWSYFDELIVGKPNSSWTFSGTGTNVSISALPLTIGISGPHAIVETPWSLHYFYDNNVFGARLTSRGLVSTNISSLLTNIDAQKASATVSIRSDSTHTVRWSIRKTTDSDNQNSLGLIYDYQLDAWASKYTPKISYYTKWINTDTGVREIIVAQYDGHIRRADVGTDFDGTAIESYVTLPWRQASAAQTHDKVVQWLDVTTYLKGAATVNVDARFADEPHEFDGASFTTYGTVPATPDSDKGFVYLGVTSRWMQLRLRATSGSFETHLPIVVGYNPTMRRI